MNKILIIEDDISINKILSHELKNKDYQVDSLYDGKEACLFMMVKRPAKRFFLMIMI